MIGAFGAAALGVLPHPVEQRRFGRRQFTSPPALTRRRFVALAPAGRSGYTLRPCVRTAFRRVLHDPAIPPRRRAAVAGLVAGAAAADDKLPPPDKAPKAEAKAEPKDDIPAGNAATVNGKPITNRDLARALKPIEKEHHAKAKPDILNFLVENALVDQYLEAIKVAIDEKDVGTQLDAFKKLVEAEKKDYKTVLDRMILTEDELKENIRGQLRWDKFVDQQATDERLKALLKSTPEIFDGSKVKAKHILITAKDDPTSKAEAEAQAKKIKADLEAEIAAKVKDIPAADDNLTGRSGPGSSRTPSPRRPRRTRSARRPATAATSSNSPAWGPWSSRSPRPRSP